MDGYGVSADFNSLLDSLHNPLCIRVRRKVRGAREVDDHAKSPSRIPKGRKDSPAVEDKSVWLTLSADREESPLD